jgi:lysophospholipase L1-like esterase
LTVARGAAVLGLLIVGCAATALVASSPALRKRARPALERLGILRPYQETDRYRALVERHRLENAQLVAPCVLLLGDSLSEGFPRDLAESRAWAVRGISGDRVRHVAARLGSVLETPCADVALLIGSNDVVHERAAPDAVGREIAALAARLQAAGKRVAITTLPPVRGTFAERNDAIRSVNERLRALVGPHLTVVDLHAALVDESGQLGERYALDGLHLTHAAYLRWAERLDSALRSPGS